MIQTDRNLSVLAAALAYARKGYPVLPCRPDNKRPLTESGFKDATTDADRITAWWQETPGAMIGIPTGPATFSVVDLDVCKETGEAIGEANAERLGLTDPLRTGLQVRTPSGGRHAYFFGDLPTNAGKIGPKIDTRGSGGYVVVPPSVSAGGAYEWDGPGLLDAEPPILPERIRDTAWRARDRVKERPQPSFRIDTGDDAGRVLDLLRTTPNTLDRDDWVRLALALKGAIGEDARADWLAFSARYSGAQAPGEAERVWNTARPDGSLTLGTVVHLLGGWSRTHRAGTGRSWLDDFNAGASKGTEGASGDHGSGGQPEQTRPLFAPASLLDGRAVPDREWLVPGLVPDRTVTLLSGDGGTGKSLLALQLAEAVATGRDWIGRGTKAGRAMFLSAEDDADELHRRLADILASTGSGFRDLDSLHIRSLAGEDALLAILDRKTGALAPTPLLGALDAALAEIRPALLVLDTLADLHSGDENSRVHARQFIGLLRGLAIRHRCAVLLLAHPSLSGIASGSGSSGSTAWNGSVRSRLYLERVQSEGYEPNPDARTLTTKKANYGRTGGEIGLTWQAGVFVADRAETGLDRMAASGKAERVFLRLLRQFTEQGRHVSASPCSTYAPKVFAEHPDAEGCTKRALKAAMEGLFGRGKIILSEHGRGASKRTHIVERTEEAG